MKCRHSSSCRSGSIFAVLWMLLAPGICLTGCFSPEPQTAEEKIQASADDFRETLETAVQDIGKRQQMQAVADHALADLQAGAAEMAGLRQEQDRLNADYNATMEEFQDLDDRMQAVRRKHVVQFIGSRQAIAALATDAEWKQIAGRDLAVLKP